MKTKHTLIAVLFASAGTLAFGQPAVVVVPGSDEHQEMRRDMEHERAERERAEHRRHEEHRELKDERRDLRRERDALKDRAHELHEHEEHEEMEHR